jgi:hypothetical protein
LFVLQLVAWSCQDGAVAVSEDVAAGAVAGKSKRIVAVSAICVIAFFHYCHSLYMRRVLILSFYKLLSISVVRLLVLE